MSKPWKDVTSLAKSFSYALRGFRFAVDNERNMRIHLATALLVMEFALLYRLERIEYMVLLLLFGLMLAAEMLNTAIEALVNLNTSGYDTLARIAKDVAAGAVFVLAVTSVLVGLLLFGHPQRLWRTLALFWEHPLLLAVAAVELVLLWLFIFRWNKRNRNRGGKE